MKVFCGEFFRLEGRQNDGPFGCHRLKKGQTCQQPTNCDVQLDLGAVPCSQQYLNNIRIPKNVVNKRSNRHLLDDANHKPCSMTSKTSTHDYVMCSVAARV